MIGAQWHGADSASMIVMDKAKVATVGEADLIIIGTAMSVELIQPQIIEGGGEIGNACMCMRQMLIMVT